MIRIGTVLMRRMLELLKRQGWNKVSLSVQKANDAVGLYEYVGFQITGQNEEEYIMVRVL